MANSIDHVQAELTTFSLFSFHSQGLDGENSRGQKKQIERRNLGLCSIEKSTPNMQNLWTS